MRIARDVCYREIDGERLCLDIILPERDEFDVLVYFHGGGLEKGSKDAVHRFSDYLCERGIALVGVDYRMYPDAKYPDFIDDAAYASAWVYENMGQYGKVKNIYLSGSSAGAYLTMMLCFDGSYLAKYGRAPLDFAGFIHDAGQPTAHFNVLRERGIDTRRIIVDESAPLYHIGNVSEYPKMMFLVSTRDMTNRYEQTQLVLSTLSHFEYDSSKIFYKLMDGGHCEHTKTNDKNGNNILATIIYDFINS